MAPSLLGRQRKHLPSPPTAAAGAGGTRQRWAPSPGGMPRQCRPRSARTHAARPVSSARPARRYIASLSSSGASRSLSVVMNSTGRGAILSATHSALNPSVSSMNSSGISLTAPGLPCLAAAANSADWRSGFRMSVRSTNSESPRSRAARDPPQIVRADRSIHRAAARYASNAGRCPRRPLRPRISPEDQRRPPRPPSHRHSSCHRCRASRRRSFLRPEPGQRRLRVPRRL